MRMPSAPEADLLMLDPSFVLSREGADWLQEDYEALPGIVVPQAFMVWLREGGPAEDMLAFVAPDDLDGFEERRARVWRLFSAVHVFSFEEAQLDGSEQEVLLALRERGDLASLVFADEWAFLQSHSWAISKLHVSLDAFREAGAAVVEYGRRLREEMVAVVIPQKGAPPALTRRVLAMAAAKWLVLGGAGAGGAMLGAIGGFVIGSGATIPVVRAFDP
jgi:hypothetical protein